MKTIINVYKEKDYFACCLGEEKNIRFLTSKNSIKKIIVLCLKNVFLRTRMKKIKHVILDVNFVSNAKMAEYNYNYRGINKITNVLSFANDILIDHGRDLGKDVTVMFLGTIVISCDKIMEEAKKYNKTFFERYMHIFVHSLLHLLGYDHINDEECRQMEQLECQILAQIGIFNPYIID